MQLPSDDKAVTPNVLHMVALKQEVCDAWAQVSAHIAEAVHVRRIKLTGALKEEARLDGDSLIIFVDVPELGRIELKVPPEDWRWNVAQGDA